ncbi:MAG: YncE family protein [Actinomycetota bacterium]
MRKLLALAVLLSSFTAVWAAPYPFSFTPVGVAPVAVAYNSVTHLFYVANNATNDVSVLAGVGAQNSHSTLLPGWGAIMQIARIPVGIGPAGVAVDANTGFVYVSNQGDNTISVITGGVGTLIAALAPKGKPWGIAIDSSVNRLCVAELGSNQVDVFDTMSRTWVASVPVSGGPIDVAAGGGYCYVTSFYTGAVSKINLTGPNVVASGLSVPGVVAAEPQGIALTPDGSLLFVANSANDSVSKINPVNLGVIQVVSLPSGSRPAGIAASASVAYVAEYGRNKLATVSTVTGAFVDLISGDQPIGVAVGGTPECAVVANNNMNTAGLYCDQTI